MLLGEVTGVERERHVVTMGDQEVPYDFLVLATGATHAYFGNDGWAEHAPGLKSIDDATEIRRRLLIAFERAEMENDPELKELMTLEAHRVRKDSRDVLSSAASRQFSELMDSLLSEMHERGEVRPELNVQVVRTALVGMIEGLLREQVVAARSGPPASFDFDDVNRWLESVVPGLGS